MRLMWSVVAFVGFTALSGCTSPEAASSAVSAPEARPSATTTTSRTTTAETSAPTTPPLTRPSWLGQRTLATDAAGFGLARSTPAELADRRLPTLDTLPPPEAEQFISTVNELVGEPLERSTWRPGCPVDPDELRYLTVSFRGFGGLAHTGELIVAADVADDIVAVFRRAWDADFPIEEMRIVTDADLEADPTGDGNNTASYVCRAVTGGSGFSQHAYGLAIDVNPFHNPYQRGDLILPELAESYLERDDPRDGMLYPDDPVVQAFKDIGWFWGGEWSSLKDWQHFSQNGQ